VSVVSRSRAVYDAPMWRSRLAVLVRSMAAGTLDRRAIWPSTPAKSTDRSSEDCGQSGSKQRTRMPFRNDFELGLEFEVERFVNREQLPKVQTGWHMDTIKGWLQV
jgi:hypothetical protein